MDLQLNRRRSRPRTRTASGGMPPEHPLDMPAAGSALQAARGAQAAARTPPSSYARFILLAVTLGVTIYGVYQMLQVVRFASMTLLQGLMIFFFAVSLGWIAFAAGSVLAGASKRRDPDRTPGDRRRLRCTALVMPIYNEDPLRTTAALQAMAEALALIDAHRGFEIVILSDSTNADAWIRETLSVHRLRDSLLRRHAGLVSAALAKHRAQIRQSGGFRDALGRPLRPHDRARCRQLDRCADAAAAGAMPCRATPIWGYCRPLRSSSARRLFSAGCSNSQPASMDRSSPADLSAWSGDSGNYWGHNAIIRMTAFAQSCGLPQLAGRKPFGGFVLSHDFVEAALMRRGGWKVRMATDCGGSWEESPPSLIDIAIRDRRWAQGNLQHMKIIGARA